MAAEVNTDEPHITEEGQWAKDMAAALAWLNSDASSGVLDKLLVPDEDENNLNFIWEPIRECLPSHHVGKALLVLLKNGMLFELILVSSSSSSSSSSSGGLGMSALNKLYSLLMYGRATAVPVRHVEELLQTRHVFLV
jgi:hypothetical protein